MIWTELGAHEAFYTCATRWANTKSIFGVEENTLCQLCYDALARAVPRSYGCCQVAPGVPHRMFKSILLVDPDSQFQKRKCKSCSKNDWSQNPLFLSCLKCGYVFCQDCSKKDLVLLHRECTDPAYQVLISRGFFDLFSKPAGTCSSCHMAFSKGKSLLMSSGYWSNSLTRKASSFGRCLNCAREGNEVLLCPLCLRPDGRRLQQSHASIHLDISHVQVRCKKYKNNSCVTCSACSNGKVNLTSIG